MELFSYLFVVFYKQIAPNGAFRRAIKPRSTVRCDLFVVVLHNRIFKLRRSNLFLSLRNISYSDTSNKENESR